MKSSEQYCVSIKNLIESQSSDTCPWIGRDVYRYNEINDVINKICVVFICLLYLFCILHFVFINLNKKK